MPRPNILLIHSDQHRYDALGSHGHTLVRTPRLDALAAAGADFTHAFTPCAVCSPARASLLTGTWPTQHGCLLIPGTEAYRPARNDLPILTRQLADAGYAVGHVGKFHQETSGLPTDHGVETFTPESDYRGWRAGAGLPPQNGGRTPWKDRDLLFGAPDPIPVEASRLAWGARQTADVIRRFASHDRPFFVRWDPSEPHLPNFPPAEALNTLATASIPPWPGFPDSLAGKPAILRRQRRIWGIDDWGWDRWAPVVARYLADVQVLDQQVGLLLDTLDALGLAGDTLVLYSTDHGDYCGGHGLMDKHFSAYDDIQRVPLLARWPGRIAPGTRSDAFVVNELDLHATILDASGLTPGPAASGRSLLQTLATGDSGRDDAFSQYFGTESGLYSLRMLRTREWKFVWHATGTDELYHLPSDPGERHNRIDDPAAAGALADTRARLVRRMEEIRDPLLNAWTRSELGQAPR